MDIQPLLGNFSRKNRISLGLLLVAGQLIFSPVLHAQSDQTKSASAYYEDAIERYNTKAYDEAVIQLKNALQENPKLLPAMVLLGRAYLETGNAGAAETALNDALTAGADPSLVAVPLAKTYLLQLKHDLLLAQNVSSRLPTKVRAELHALRARTAMEISAREKLEKELALAEKLNPTNANLLALKVTLALKGNNLDLADSLTKTMLKHHPRHVETWQSIASVKHLQGDTSGALESYSKVIAIDPGNASARIARIGLLLDLDRDDETTADFEALSKVGTTGPRVNYLRSIKLAKAGDEHGSRQALNDVISVIDTLGPELVNRNPQLLVTAGNANHSLKNLESARFYFETYRELGGRELLPMIALANIYLAQNEHHEAIGILEDIASALPNNLGILSMLAEAYQGSGDSDRAIALLERVTSIVNEDPQLETQLALSRIQAGYKEQGVRELKNVFGKGENRAFAGFPLAITLLHSGAFDEAISVASKLSDGEPDNLNYKNLIGIAQVGKGDLAGAKSTFTEMLTLNPDHLPTLINLAKIERHRRNFDLAVTVLQDLLKTHPNNPQVLVELSRLEKARSDLPSALRWAKNASQISNKFAVQKHLIQLLVEMNQSEEALKIALNLDSLLPDNYQVKKLLVQTQLAAGQQDQAKSLLREMASDAQFNSEKLVEIAEMQAYSGDLENAGYTLFKAIQGTPEHFRAQSLLADIELRLNRLEEAFERADLLKQRYPSSNVGYRIAGDVLVRRDEYSKAIKQYQAGIERAADSQLTIKLYIAHRNNRDLPAAEKSLRSWLESNQDDLFARNALAEFYLGTNAYRKAETEYKLLVAARPEDPLILNNMANLYDKLNQPEQAMKFAKSALSLAPHNPLINDTLGWLLIKSENYQEGIGYLREALTRAADNSEIRYHLAVALHQLNRDEEAVMELTHALAEKQPFEGRGSAEALLLELKRN